MKRLWYFAFVLAAMSAAAAAQPKPNVLFIMADDYRPEVSSYGSRALTPSLDRLARRAVQFERAYCQQALCNPSRSSMLTGLRPDTIRIWNNGTHFREVVPEVMTLPLYFKENGYTTRCVGKIFHNWHTKEKGDSRSWSAPEFLHYATHGDDAPIVVGAVPVNHATGGPRKYSNVHMCEARDVPDEAYYDGRVAAEAVRVLAEVKDEPFFLAVGFWKPHAPFNAPKKYWDLYDRAKLPPLDPRRPEGAPPIAFHGSPEILGARAEGVKLTPEQVQELRHGYFANISYMDAQLGKVLAALERSSAADRTIIIFVGDHGYHIGEHGLWGKLSNFEHDARVPLMIAPPGSPHAGKRTHALVELIDLFPTLVELCGLPPVGRGPGSSPEYAPGRSARAAALEGASLVPILRNPTASVKPAAFTQHPRPAHYDREPGRIPAAMGCSVRTPRVRYTEWRDWKTGNVIGRELYGEDDEPAETRNRIDDPSLADARREAEELLRQRFPRRTAEL